MSVVDVAITGASGMIGKRLRERLVEAGHMPRAVPRASAVPACGAIVNLAGEPIAQRWTEAAKKRIHASRVEGTRHLVNALSTQSQRPRVLVCASAVGYYGSRGDEILTENSPPGSGFLAQVVMDWEEAARSRRGAGNPRGPPPIRHGAGTRRSARQVASAFSSRRRRPIGLGPPMDVVDPRDDAVNLILFAMEFRRGISRGAFNATAPDPVTNDEFTSRLATALHRPAIFPVPAFALKLAFGEMSEVLLDSQRVLPPAAKAAGFPFPIPRAGRGIRSYPGHRT